jgi:hypothetical protein
MMATEFVRRYAAARRAYHANDDAGLYSHMDELSANCTTEQWSMVDWAFDNGAPEYRLVKRWADRNGDEA